MSQDPTRRSTLRWASALMATRRCSGSGSNRTKVPSSGCASCHPTKHTSWGPRLNELKHRGVDDILLSVVDGLKGFPDAITAVFPETIVQTCIVHLLRNSMAFVSWKDRKSLAAALKAIYRAVDADTAEKALTAFEAGPWGQRYPAIGQSWRRARSSRSLRSPMMSAGSSIQPMPLNRSMPSSGAPSGPEATSPAMRPQPSSSI